MGHDGEVSCMRVSRTGSILVSGQKGSQILPGKPSKVIVWDIPKRKLVWEVTDLAGSVLSVDISPDSRFLVASGENLLQLVFDVHVGEIVYSKRSESVCQMCIFSDRISPIEEYVFMTVFDSQVFKNTLHFDLLSMTHTVKSQKIPTTNLLRKPVDVAILGDYCILSSTTGDLCVYSLSESKFCGPFTSGNQSISFIAATSGTELAYVSGSHKVACIEITPYPLSFKVSREVYSSEHKIIGICCCNANRNLLLSLSNGSAVSVDIDSAEKPKVLPFFRSPSKISVITSHSSIPHEIVSGTDNGEIWRWNSELLSPIECISLSKVGSVTCISVLDKVIHCGFSSGQIKVLIDWKVRCEIPTAHRGSVTCIDSFSGFYVSGGEDNVVRVWMHSSLLAQFSQSTGTILGLAIDRNYDKILYTYNNKREIFALDIKALKLVKKFSAVKFGNIVGMAQKQHGLDSVLVTSHYEGFVVVWDFDYDAPLFEIGINGVRFTSLSAGATESVVLCGTSAGQLCNVIFSEQNTYHSRHNEVSSAAVVCVSSCGGLILDSEGHIFVVTV